MPANGGVPLLVDGKIAGAVGACLAEIDARITQSLSGSELLSGVSGQQLSRRNSG
jgi:uncharacterized protein GlcG (DUF336 family)